jgi:Lar family restriction alleviation protein
MNKPTELLPCPFCGESDFEFHNLPADAADTTPWFVLCRSCEANGPRGETKVEAITRWNTRALTTDTTGDQR